MSTEIKLLRASYWSAAIADFFIAVTVLMPERMGLTEFVYPMGLTSAIAFSWGVLLLFADQKPVERRWVLLPTILVITLLSAVRLWFSLDGKIDFSIGYLLLGVSLIALLSYSYYYSVRKK